MLVVQIRLTADMVEKLDDLVESGRYPSKSEAIRDATRKLVVLVWQNFVKHKT